MGRVLVTRQLPAGSLEPLTAAHHTVIQLGEERALSPDELANEARDVDGIICLLTDRIDAAVLLAGAGHGGRLKVVSNVAVGCDNIDVNAAKAAGVTVCTTPGVLDETTADLAFALVLAASRRMSDAERDLRSGHWKGWEINQYLGRDVHGATMGIVGFGRIGQAVSRRAQGFAMRVLHHARHDTGHEGYVANLDDLLAAADIVTLHVPLTPDTRQLIDRRRLNLMKPGAVLVNTARGAIVDEDALADSLTSGHLFAAGLDVFENEPNVNPRLLDLPGTVLLPHIGSASTATRSRMALLAAQSVVEVLTRPDPVTR